jgi:hypothetical protein
MPYSHQKKNPCPTARIRYYGHAASVGREAFGAIADEPVFDDHQRPAGNTALTFGRFLEPNGPPKDQRQRVLFPAGLVGRVVRALTAKSYKVRVDNEPIVAPTDDQLNLQAPGRVRRACARPRSLFIVRKLKDRIGFIAELHKLVPESHILVVAQNNREAREVAGKLAEATGREVTWGWEQRHAYPWLCVKSQGSLSGDSAWQWGFVFFLDAESAVTTTATGFISPGSETIRVGFLARDVHQLHEVERGVLEALFGPVDKQGGFADVSVAWLRSPTHAQTRFANKVERMRANVWKTYPRNALIARAARALSEVNFCVLERLGLKEVAIDLLGANPAEPPTVAIIVANAEQGRELARLLPGWRLEAAGYTPLPGKLVTDDRVIMTRVRASDELLMTTVVIYAAGGSDWWLEHVRLGIAWGPENTLIIDIADHDDAESLSEVSSRAAGYRHRGYQEVPPVDPNPGVANVAVPTESEPASETSHRPKQEGGAGVTLRS